MKSKAYTRFWLLSIICVLVVSAYPLYMGFRVVSDMIRFGAVYAENYPKYIIPYTPISIAVITGVLLMPLIHRRRKQHDIIIAVLICITVFYTAEFLLESMVIVTTTMETKLESYQMYMCIQPAEWLKPSFQTEVNILMGQYSPAFKLHFYLISMVLILALVNSFYGFGQMILTGDRTRLQSLILQSASGVIFLGLCILACFTAFFRTGTILVSPVSAALMCVFFIVFGVTAGIFTGSFLLKKERKLTVCLTTAVSGGITLVMYIGEMVLLSGQLYRFGTTFFFVGIPGIVLAPIDLLVILLSASVTGFIMHLLTRK